MDKTECPRCESPQKFARLVRDAEDKPWKEVFIHCKICNFVEVIGVTSGLLEQAYLKRKKILRRYNNEVDRFGAPSSSTVAAHDRVTRRVLKIKAELQGLVNQHESQAN
jgi:hypothetical protein